MGRMSYVRKIIPTLVELLEQFNVLSRKNVHFNMRKNDNSLFMIEEEECTFQYGEEQQ